MNIPGLFIRRAVMTTLVMISFVVLGIFGYLQLPVAALPRVDFPVIQVSAVLPGASPETMASSVATPLERQFATIAGINSITSTNAQGITSIILMFDLSRNIDQAALDVQTALTTAARLLPTQMTTPPSFRKVNPADQPVLFLAFGSSTMPLSAVDEYAETLAAQRISSLPGVAQVMVFGSQKYAVRVQVDPNALAVKGISLGDVQQAIAAADSNIPLGTLSGPQQTLVLQTGGQLASAAQYRPLIITYRNGQPVRLGDVAQILDSVQNDKIATWYNKTRSVVLAVQRQPDANTINVVDRVKALLPSIRAQIPASVDVQLIADRSVSIRNSVHDVQYTLMLAIALVVLVIFLFLRSPTVTIIPALALPVSLIGTFAGMYVLGYSIDNLSLLALTLSVGFVVDDAIVMLENIVRHVEEGMTPMEAAFKGSREIAFTILSMTLSLVAVFIPVLFMGGIVGRLFREFAVTISMTILISGVVSLTLTPMLSSRFLKPAPTQRNAFYRGAEAAFNAMLGAYDWTLRRALAHRRITLMVAVGSLMATVYLFVIVPKGFFPIEDTGLIFATTEGPQDISFDAMKALQQTAAHIVQQDPAVQMVTSTVGAGGFSATVNTGNLFIGLKPLADRKVTIMQAIQRLRSELAHIPGINVYMQPVQNINVGGRMSKAQYQYTVQGSDFSQLVRIEQTLQTRIGKLPGMQDVTSNLQLKSPQLFVSIDRDRAATLDVTTDQIRNTLYTAFGARSVATIYTPTNNYDVILELGPKFSEDPSALSHVYVRGNSGQLVPLDAMVRLTRTSGPLTVNHQAGMPAITISFNLAPGVSLGDAVDRIRQVERDMNLPPTIFTSFQGTAQVFQSSLAGQGMLLLGAIYVMYVVLGILYESFLHPITILSGLPAAGLGALLTLLIFKVNLSVIAIIGIIMLIGIVKKNGIMMVDVALEHQRSSDTMTPEQAIYEACLLRFRPIMMTTMAAIMGTLPIALGLGAGGELRQPLGLVVVGGLLVSQLLTLYIIAVIYLSLESAKRAVHRWRQPAGA